MDTPTDGTSIAACNRGLGLLNGSGTKIGKAHLQWAFSEAAVLFLRKNPTAQLDLAKLAHKHGKAKALTILAHQLARAVDYILSRQQTFEAKKFFGPSETYRLRPAADKAASLEG